MLPRTLWTKYRTDDGRRWFCIWHQWNLVGRVWDVARFEIR